MIISVKATPNSKHNAIKRYENGILYAAVAAPADKGKANAELTRYLTEVFGQPVKLLTGSTARMKKIGVSLSQEELETAITRAL